MEERSSPSSCPTSSINPRLPYAIVDDGVWTTSTASIRGHHLISPKYSVSQNRYEINSTAEKLRANLNEILRNTTVRECRSFPLAEKSREWEELKRNEGKSRSESSNQNHKIKTDVEIIMSSESMQSATVRVQMFTFEK